MRWADAKGKLNNKKIYNYLSHSHPQLRWRMAKSPTPPPAPYGEKVRSGLKTGEGGEQATKSPYNKKQIFSRLRRFIEKKKRVAPGKAQPGFIYTRRVRAVVCGPGLSPHLKMVTGLAHYCA